MGKAFSKYWPFIILLSIDLTLIALHLVNFWRPLGSYNAFYMEGNNSFAEYFQNIKWVAMIVLSIMTARKQNDKKYYSWVLLFLILFLEDVFRIHQVITSFISQSVPGGISIRQWKTVELFIAFIIGLLAIMPLIRNYKNADSIFRKQSKILLVLLALLVFFGIIMDQTHRLYYVLSNWKREFAIGIIEDGGEMITASCILGYLTILYIKKPRIFKN